MQTGKRSAIIGDIGGTHARFAICDVDQLSVNHFAVFQTAMFASLPDAVAHYLESVPDRPALAGFSIADPLTGPSVGVENSSWSFTAEDVRAACGADKLHFVNNFEALALSLPYLNAHDRRQISGNQPVADAPMIVLGTGGEFGAAALIGTSGRRTPVAGAAGHIAMAATGEREMAIMEGIGGGHGYMPLQSVLSGRGLEAIHKSLSRLEGLPEPDVSAIDIISLALEDGDALSVDTLDFFVSVLARVAGDLALLFDARGGVYLGRGIAPRILQLLDSDRFREKFADKGAMSTFLENIPVHAILANDAGLRGAAIATSEAFPM